MDELARIKNHVASHGVGCAVMKDHVAISVLWVSKTLGGEDRHLETIYRVRSLDEARDALGCDCRLRE